MDVTPVDRTSQAPLAPSSSFLDRLVGALRLDPATYAEVAGDRQATRQAIAIVTAISIFVALPRSALSPVAQNLSMGEFGIVLVIVAIVGGIGGSLGLLLNAWLFSIGANFAVRRSDRATNFRRLLRALGFANAPFAFELLAMLPTICGFIAIAVGLWTIAAFIIAVHKALEVTPGRALAIMISSWVGAIVLPALAFSLLFIVIRVIRVVRGG